MSVCPGSYHVAPEYQGVTELAGLPENARCSICKQSVAVDGFFRFKLHPAARPDDERDALIARVTQAERERDELRRTIRATVLAMEHEGPKMDGAENRRAVAVWRERLDAALAKGGA